MRRIWFEHRYQIAKGVIGILLPDSGRIGHGGDISLVQVRCRAAVGQYFGHSPTDPIIFPDRRGRGTLRGNVRLRTPSRFSQRRAGIWAECRINF